MEEGQLTVDAGVEPMYKKMDDFVQLIWVYTIF